MDFNEKINRYNTNSLKYDSKKQRNKPEDVFPMWVADMDFRCPQEVIDDMAKKLEHGIFGYSQTNDNYFEAIYHWYLKHFQIELHKSWLITTPGVVFALATAIKTLTKENDHVLINSPVYHLFSEVIKDNNRKVISSDLINHNGHYEIDFNDLEEKIRKYHIKLYLLCSPHNPVCRVWTKEELNKIVSICKKYDVYIVSDEIHSDFVWEGKHTCLIKYQDYLDHIILCTSPSKTFNIAGLQVSNIFIPNQNIRDIFEKEINKTGYGSLNIFGIVAGQSAYTKGEKWLQELKQYLKENITYTEQYFKTKIPKIKVIHPEGTYLLWLDFSRTGMSDKQIEDILVNKAKLWLDPGTKFGSCGKNFQRLNIALPRENLEFALKQIANFFD